MIAICAMILPGISGSFLLLIMLGTIGLRTLPGLYVGERLSWSDCLFTSANAVCVTGLIVVDTPNYWTPFGQLVILLLFQIGGFGIMTSATLLGLLADARREGQLTIRPARLISVVSAATYSGTLSRSTPKPPMYMGLRT